MTSTIPCKFLSCWKQYLWKNSIYGKIQNDCFNYQVWTKNLLWVSFSQICFIYFGSFSLCTLSCSAPEEVDVLKFNSKFESGNLRKVIQIRK